MEASIAQLDQERLAFPRGGLDRAVFELNETKDRWASLGLEARISLLDRTLNWTAQGAEAQVKHACRAKRIAFESPQAAEEWLGGPLVVLRNLRLLRDSLASALAHGRPYLPPEAFGRRPSGQIAAQVFPVSLYDRMLYTGFSGEVVMEPGVDSVNEVRAGMGATALGGPGVVGKVALVLGAGNVASIGPMDVLHKLFVENQVCLLKMNPVNGYLAQHVERAFKPLVDAGALRVVGGGAEEGDYLVHHLGVDEIHITGSDRVHDIIVWGASGPEQARNRAAGRPKINKRITSELGCVTPVLIVPGDWSVRELEFQAQNVATMVANNASFNCNAAKLLITAAGWPQRGVFLDRVEQVLSRLPGRRAYYPGSQRKYEAFLDAHPMARQLITPRAGEVPWTTIFGVDSGRPDDIVFKQEAWCGILSETALPADDAESFLDRAVDFANEQVWGTLSCSVLCDPRTKEQLGEVLERGLDRLRYGAVALNHWAAMAYGFGSTTWGAFPGHTLDNVGSGIGVVHNTFMFHRPQKSLIRGPFTMIPKPPWFATHKAAHKVARRLIPFEREPAAWRLPGVICQALRG
jgi:hypothetical protein